MLLAVDVGNTNTVLGLFDPAGNLTDSWRVRTDALATADELALLYRGLLGSAQPTGIAACSTVPAVLRQVRAMIARYFADIPTVVVEPGVRTGVPVLIDNPKEVGADRIANVVAAAHLFPGAAAVVVDFGTATNYDVVSARGEYLGGVLAPGIELSLDALAARAAQLRKVEIVTPRSVIGKGTVEALQSGLVFGTAGQVDGIVERITAELGHPVTVIATGGLAPLVISASRTLEHHVPELTLVGLRLIFDKNPQPPDKSSGNDAEPRVAARSGR